MKAAIIAISIIVVAVVLYGIFARDTSSTGGGGSQDVHTGALGFLKGILNGLHLSVAP